MTMTIRVGDAAKDVTGISVRVGGTLKTVTEGWVRVGGALRLFFAMIKVVLSTYTAIGRSNSASVVTVYSAPVTATVTGGVGTLAYAWTRTAADAQPWTITDPTAATTTFSTVADQGESFDATFICTVTDQAGQVIASDPVAVNCSNIYYGGGYGGPGPGPYP